MPRRLATRDADFEAAFQALVTARRQPDADVSAAVAAIVADVRERGDAALIDHTSRLDGLKVTPAGLRIGGHEIDAAVAACDAETLAALRFAAERIEDFHRRQLPHDARYTDAAGVTLGVRWTPLAAVGMYVPGGQAAYPSSVLMNALPARVAGVDRVAMTVPTPGGKLNPLVLAAARIAGVEEIYRVGGAQAVAALAYGTPSIAPVDKVVGPGGAYVAEAKRQVFGHVGIDLIAGPSEVLVVADGDNDPGRTTCCRRRAAPASRRAWGFWISSSAPRSCAATGRPWRRLVRRRSRWPAPRGCRRTPIRWRSASTARAVGKTWCRASRQVAPASASSA